MEPVVIRVPASTANLGSGYDAFGLALARYNTVQAVFAGPGVWRVEVTGEGADVVPTDERNLVARAMAELFLEVGERRGATVVCANDVPFGRGLGSSSAAIVGGLVAANELAGRPLGRDGIFRMAARIEGHPDNVAATVFGGFTICWSQDGEPCVTHVDPAGGLAAVVVLSEGTLPTKRSRAMLPASVPHADAAFDAGRAGLLATAIALGRRELIEPGMNDRLHEPYRAAAVTDLQDVREALRAAGADGAALSGAGPSVLGLVAGSDDREAMERAREVARTAGSLLESGCGRPAPVAVALDRRGATVVAS